MTESKHTEGEKLLEQYLASMDSYAENDPNLNTELTLPRVIVWHNAMARIPFPNKLFCGPYDTHFGLLGKRMGQWGKLLHSAETFSHVI